MITKISPSEFEEKVLKSTLPVLVDFYADWCGPCKMAEPVLDELSNTHQDKIVFVKVNVDEAGEIAGKYSVMSIPTTILFVKGVEIERQVGFAGKEGFETLLTKHLV
jgi:thioredoxin 1